MRIALKAAACRALACHIRLRLGDGQWNLVDREPERLPALSLKGELPSAR